jgi:hypothetical protein
MYHLLSIILARPSVRWLLFLTCLTIMLYGTFRPEPPPDLFAHSDKVGHGFGFTALALTARMAMHRVPWLLFWPGMAGFAMLLEYLQAAWRPLRIFSLADGYANMFGVAIALAMVAGWRLLNIIRASDREPVTDRKSR